MGAHAGDRDRLRRMHDVLAPGTRLGPFEIVDLIGSGGMGQVYRALDSRLGRHVAIKTLAAADATDEDRVRRFEAEARAASALNHPNLLAVFDVGREGDVSYIVSELLQGETLRARLRDGAVAERQVVDYISQVARGLAAAHAHGIVHRDLKPENLFLRSDRVVKILDFGVAKLIAPRTSDSTTALTTTSTGTGLIVGTLGYLAPEQILGEPLDHRIDIFALGVVMHELLSGTHPFRRDTDPETLTAILKEDPPPLPPGVTPAVAGIVRRCLEKRRDDRFHSAHDLALALELLGTLPGGAPAAAGTKAGVSRRQALVYGASSVALLAAGAAGGALLGGPGSPTPPSLRRLTFRRGIVRSARVAPDGQTILYGALWDDDSCRVHTVRVDGPESRPLELPQANVLAISRTGELALALGTHRLGVVTYGTLAQVSIAGGAPREMLEGVKFADWSPDGTTLAIIRNVDGRDRLEYPIGNVLVQPEVGGHTGLGFARVSPDGRRVAFVHYRSPNSLVGRVCLVDQTGAVELLTDEYLNIHGLAWNGDEIWYTAADDRPLFRALAAVSARGERRTLTRMPGNATLWDVFPDGRLVIAHTDDRTVMIAHLDGDTTGRDLSWLDASWAADLSRDGRRVLFTETGQGGGPAGAVYVRGTDGTPAVRLGSGRALALSPDGRWALAVPLEAPSPYLDVLPTGAGEPRRLPTNGLHYDAARWLPSGARIVAAATEPGRRTRLYLVDPTIGRAEAFTPEGVRTWSVSPDGSAIAANGPDAEIRLYFVDGRPPVVVPGTTGAERLVAWIESGLLVMQSSPDSPPGQIYRLDIATGHQQPWTNVFARTSAGTMAIVNFNATPDGRSYIHTLHLALSNLYLADGLV
jgi:Tol biopolymer transport system component